MYELYVAAIWLWECGKQSTHRHAVISISQGVNKRRVSETQTSVRDVTRHHEHSISNTNQCQRRHPTSWTQYIKHKPVSETSPDIMNTLYQTQTSVRDVTRHHEHSISNTNQCQRRHPTSWTHYIKHKPVSETSPDIMNTVYQTQTSVRDFTRHHEYSTSNTNQCQRRHPTSWTQYIKHKPVSETSPDIMNTVYQTQTSVRDVTRHHEHSISNTTGGHSLY